MYVAVTDFRLEPGVIVQCIHTYTHTYFIWNLVYLLIIMYIYHVLINALATHIIHINLNTIFYTHIEDSPTTVSYTHLTLPTSSYV